MKKSQNPEIVYPPILAEISTSPKEIKATLKNIYLEDGHRETLGRFIIEAEKTPLNMDKIDMLYHVNFRESSEQSEEFIKTVEKLAEIQDERERIDALLKLLKSQVTYGYENTLIEKAEALGIEKQELDKFGAKGNANVKFTELLKYGVGICGHLSEAYLYLANKAKLKGIIVHSHDLHPPINVLRKDNSKKLFRSVNLSEKTANHAWTEIQLQDGSWIPVDPSTELTGTTKDGLETFKMAGYQGNVAHSIDFNFEGQSDLGQQGTDQFIGTVPAGDGHFTIDMKIGLRRRLLIGDQKPPPKRKYESQEEKVNISPINYLNGVNFTDAKFESA